MTLDEVFNSIEPVKSMASAQHAPGSTAPRPSRMPTKSEATRTLSSLKLAQERATSDAEWYGFQGQISYWQCMANILLAVEFSGPDHLPDVPIPIFARYTDVRESGPLLEEFGERVLAQSRRFRTTA